MRPTSTLPFDVFRNTLDTEFEILYAYSRHIQVGPTSEQAQDNQRMLFDIFYHRFEVNELLCLSRMLTERCITL